MVRLEIDPEEAKVLSELLEARLRELPPEMSHTAHREYRERLKREQHVVEGLLSRLWQGARSEAS